MKNRTIAAIALLITMCAWAAPAQETEPQEKLLINYPGKAWAIAINSPGFVVETREHKPDGREYLVANNATTGVVLSVMLEKGNGPADASSCPDYLQNRVRSLPPDIAVTGVHPSRIGDLAVIEYLIPVAQKIPVRQKNFVACLTHEDVYVDVHLSKVQFRDSDEALFTEALSKVNIAAAGGAAATAAGSSTKANNKNSLDYMREGSRFYISNDFQGAIGPYQKALDLEKEQPQLERNMWLVLVDNLGMAYGITGDLKQAQQTFDYGLSKEPKYPMFYYNLACVSAERNDMDTTIDYLQKAFALKTNVISGETMPDPRKDDSFQSFMSNERFRKFVESLYAPN
jgi:tetratricopeptide (TPR) repeat protein